MLLLYMYRTLQPEYKYADYLSRICRQVLLEQEVVEQV